MNTGAFVPCLCTSENTALKRRPIRLGTGYYRNGEGFKWRSDMKRMLFRSIALNAVRRMKWGEEQEQDRVANAEIRMREGHTGDNIDGLGNSRHAEF